MPRTPREVGKQVQTAVNEQVRDLPIHAARLAMFGVGRTLLLTDRVTKDYRDLKEGEFRPVIDRLRGDAEKITGKVGNRISTRVEQATGLLAETPVGKVIELVIPKPAEPVAATPVASPPEVAVGKPKTVTVPKPAEPVREPVTVPAAAAPPVAEPNPAEPELEAKAVVEPVAAAKPKKKAAPKKNATAKLSEADLPVPNYNELSHASLRARLRKLTGPEVAILREYEAANAGREEILKMYENRIAKLSEQE